MDSNQITQKIVIKNNQPKIEVGPVGGDFSLFAVKVNRMLGHDDVLELGVRADGEKFAWLNDEPVEFSLLKFEADNARCGICERKHPVLLSSSFQFSNKYACASCASRKDWLDERGLLKPDVHL